MKKGVLVTIAAFSMFGVNANAQLETVKTESGSVSGHGDEVKKYFGIPYAKAPIGDLRWKPPVSAESWKGVKDGSHFGPDCMQPSEYPELRGDGMSEDCLSVNVWSPAKDSKDQLPVMVWIHGGGFKYGAGSHPSYDGEALARRGVVVVTLNYRMGLLGYMAHPQLTAESPNHSSGNYGLMDQIAALKWVQKNIQSFGGDPKKVTVFGQSAGAHAISTLLVLPEAKGLFQQAIMQSVGVMRPMASLKDAENYGLQFGTDISELRKVPAAELIQQLAKAKKFSKVMTNGAMPSLIVDGHLVRQPDYQSFARGDYLKVPIIVGSNANEGGGAAKKMPIKTASELTNYLADTFGEFKEQADSVYQVNDNNAVEQTVADLYGDLQFRFGTREMLRRDAENNVPAYQYIFTRSRNGTTRAPIHGDELQYVFGNLEASHRGKHKKFDEVDVRVSAQMSTAWTNFAKTGDPNGGAIAGWNQYSPQHSVPFEFGDVGWKVKDEDTKRLDMIESFYEKMRR